MLMISSFLNKESYLKFSNKKCYMLSVYIIFLYNCSSLGTIQKSAFTDSFLGYSPSWSQGAILPF